MRSLKLNDPNALRLSLRAAVKTSHDQLLLHKLHCVLLVGLGRHCHEVADWFGDSTRTVERWVNAYNQSGTAGLRWQRHVGRHPRLPPEIAQRVAFEVSQPPVMCGFPDTRWGARLLMQHLQAHYSVTISLRQCQRTLRYINRSMPGPLLDGNDTVASRKSPV